MAAYVQEAVRSMIVKRPPPLTHEQWEKLLDELADSVPADVPPLSDYAVSREGMYEERIAQIIGDIAAEDPAHI